MIYHDISIYQYCVRMYRYHIVTIMSIYCCISNQNCLYTDISISHHCCRYVAHPWYSIAIILECICGERTSRAVCCTLAHGTWPAFHASFIGKVICEFNRGGANSTIIVTIMAKRTTLTFIRYINVLVCMSLKSLYALANPVETFHYILEWQTNRQTDRQTEAIA